MSDPKNIPLDQARPGDIVHLKPMVLAHNTGWPSLAALSVENIRRAFHKAEIDHIERAPRPLEVGDRVQGGVDRGTIHAIVGERAAVIWDCSTANWPLLTSLERVDG
jgi:hypothetical protein